MTKLQALIFDVDGTLAETECDGHRVAFNRAFADFDLPWIWDIDLYGQLLNIGGGKERVSHYIQHHHPEIPNTFTLEEIPALHQRKNQHYAKILDKGEIGLRPGVLRLIQAAQASQIKLAIATTSSLSNTLKLLSLQLGDRAETWFEVIGAGDIVPHKKPAPDIYHYVLAKLQLPPENCLVFEDSEAGVSAARQANLKTVMTLNTYTHQHRQDQANLVVDHLGDPNHPAQILAGQIDPFLGMITLEICEQILHQDD